MKSAYSYNPTPWPPVEEGESKMSTWKVSSMSPSHGFLVLWLKEFVSLHQLNLQYTEHRSYACHVVGKGILQAEGRESSTDSGNETHSKHSISEPQLALRLRCTHLFSRHYWFPTRSPQVFFSPVLSAHPSACAFLLIAHTCNRLQRIVIGLWSLLTIWIASRKQLQQMVPAVVNSWLISGCKSSLLWRDGKQTLRWNLYFRAPLSFSLGLGFTWNHTLDELPLCLPFSLS